MDRCAWSLGGVAGVCALALAGLWVFGATRPAGHVATVTHVFAAPPERVWSAVSAVDQYPRWRSGLSAAVRTGERIEERDRFGKVRAMRVLEEIPVERLVTAIVDSAVFGGTWTLTLRPEGDGTRVEIVERGEIRSFLLRAVAALFHDSASTARTWLADLDRHLSDGR